MEHQPSVDRRSHSQVPSPIAMGKKGIDFSSLRIDDDEDEYSSSSSEEYTDDDEDEEDEEYEVENVWSPTHPHDLDSFPHSILLDVQAYFDDRINATTADAPLIKDHRIRVTFWIAHPPGVSCLTVHSNGVEPSEFTNMPMVVAAQDDLVLLRVAIGPHTHHCPNNYINNYYVYQAGTNPTLRRLADASSFVFADCSAGIVRRGDGSYIIAAIHWAGVHGQYDLHQFDSKTWTWSTRLMHVDKPQRFSRILTNKVLVIGGKDGLVAWIDLCNGILFCEVLTSRTVLRYCALPLPFSKKLVGPPEQFRDIAIVGGHIRFFEMRLKVKHHPVSFNTTLISKVLEATTWKMIEPWQNWQKDRRLDMFKIPVDKSDCVLLHDVLNGQDTLIAFERLQGGHPALSLHDDDVVYVMAKAKEMSRRAVVFAVNMRKKVLQGVSKFDAKRAYGFSYTYLQSGISNYLTAESSARGKARDGIPQGGSRIALKPIDNMYKGKAAESSTDRITKAGGIYKSNADTQAGAIYKSNAADSSWVQVSRRGKQKA
ncbi:uncharacterized protein LOC123400088 isoform X2 [Hordeum vulgare subsp. vulgare]|uniref:uncharacterized protein LOC123400088 isoform X2 n=1 Tax=Hordeum vulgare subsp. vulgare TaxID=112509 RepID=UPI001D1A3BF2|nr:uncharacterized protein LOC123400088 isoform X2 [Hordeum vulgare subsp. vulgare]